MCWMCLNPLVLLLLFCLTLLKLSERCDTGGRLSVETLPVPAIRCFFIPQFPGFVHRFTSTPFRSTPRVALLYLLLNGPKANASCPGLPTTRGFMMRWRGTWAAQGLGSCLRRALLNLHKQADQLAPISLWCHSSGKAILDPPSLLTSQGHPRWASRSNTGHHHFYSIFNSKSWKC